MHADYDPVAAAYAAHFSDELARKPFDRMMLDWLATRVGGRGPICDIGCGPGHVAAYLHAGGAPACGIDLSEAMVREAASRHPEIRFDQGDMLALKDVEDASFGGISAFYAIVNIPRALVGQALAELGRVLRPGGVLLLSFHIGDEVRHLDEMLGVTVDLEFTFFPTDLVKGALHSAGLVVTEAIERDPYPEDVEHQSRRAYIFAEKPTADPVPSRR